MDRVSDRFFERSFEERFRRSVEAFRLREGLSARAFGSAALGEPDFIEGRLSRASMLRLETVDTVLEFMGEPRLGILFVCEVEAFLAITGTSAYRLGLDAAGDASFVRRLRAGDSPFLGVVDRARRWMGSHSSSAQRRAIAAATLYVDEWRVGVASGPGCAALCPVAHGHTRASDLPRYLNTPQTAQMLGLSPRTLENLRRTGKGPRYSKLGGRVVYALSDIEQWVRSRRRYSTRSGKRAGPKRATQGSKNRSCRTNGLPGGSE